MAITTSWPADYGRNLGPSVSQSLTSEAIGHAEDISDIITNIDPDQTYFLSRFGVGDDCQTLSFSWLTEGLKPAKVNAHLEKEDYLGVKGGSLSGLENNVQKFVNSDMISDWQKKVKKVYSEDERSRHLTNLYAQHARDIEYALVNNDIRRAESGNTAALTGGIPFFEQVQNMPAVVEVSNSTPTGVIAVYKEAAHTNLAEHGLETGDFVYLTATTMPTGLAKDKIYYVRLDATTPKSKFTLFNTQKGATENIEADQVVPSTAGTAVGVVMNNVVDLGGAKQFALADLDAVMEMCYRRGGNPTIAVMSSSNKKRFSSLVSAVATTQRSMKGDRKLDLVADVVQTDFGTLTAEVHRMYADNRIDLMDMNYWNLRWLERTHEVEGIAKKGSYEELIVQSTLGLEGTQPKASGALVNVQRA